MIPSSTPASSRPTALIRLHQTFDVLCGMAVLLAVFAAANTDRMPDGLRQFLALRVTIKNCVLLFFLLSGWVALLKIFGVYRLEQYRSVLRGITRHIGACTAAALIALAFPLSSKSGAISSVTIAWYWIGLVLSGLIGRVATSYLMMRLPSLAKWRRNILIVGTGPRAASLSAEVEDAPGSPNRVIGFMDKEIYPEAESNVRVGFVGTLDELEPFLMRQVVDQVLIALPMRSCYDDIQKSIEICERVGVKVDYLSDPFRVSLGRPEQVMEGRLSVVSLKTPQDDVAAVFAKRCMDVTGAIAGIILFSPVMLIAAIGIRLTSKGPALFTQDRFGVNKRTFRMYKFRTMVTNAEALQASLESLNEVAGPVFKIRQDPRVTPFGRFLRKTSIDELPQFFNVLAGDMSLVGPRPLPRRDVSQFNQGWLMRRFSVKPGLTCLWQVRGRSNTSFEHWIAQDLEYIDTWSFALDLKILVRTVPAVMKGSGAM